MERLTKREYGEISCTSREILCSSYCNSCSQGTCDCEIVENMVEKLADYEDLEEQGRLLKLPCKVGDTVYRISQNFHTHMEYMEKTSVGKISIDRNGVYIHCVCKPHVKMALGLRVFLTKSEAEAKLKELRGGENG